MKNKIGLACIAVMGVCVSGLAEASIEINLNPGYAIPMGTSADYLGQSPSLDGSLLFKLAPWLKAGLQTGYIFGSRLEADAAGVNQRDNDYDGVPDTNLTYTSDVDYQIVHLEPVFKMSRTLGGGRVRWEPYFTAGGGAYWVHNTGGTVQYHGTTSGGSSIAAPSVGRAIAAPIDESVMVESSTDFNLGFNVGGGLSCILTDHFVIGADLLYRQIIYSETSDIQYLIPSLRLAFQF